MQKEESGMLITLVFVCDYSYETQRNGLVFIYDMTDSKYANFDYELSIKILSLLKVRIVAKSFVDCFLFTA